MGRLTIGMLMLTVLLTAPAIAAGRPAYEPEIQVAAQRFDLPARWIKAVIEAESGGDVRAVSSKGAQGLMQLMPDTWVEMRERYAIDGDVFDPAANIMAGAAYLAEMHGRFGAPGLFGAYNAGPSRYEAHLRDGRSLPAETRAYLAKLSALVGTGEGQSQQLFMPLNAADGRLFIPLSKTGAGRQ